MFLWLCLLLFQTPAPPAPATDGIITGRVLDAAGAPVPAAIVALQPATGGRTAIQRVLTDELGRYFFDQLAPGRYSLDATKSGWANGSYGRKRADGPGVPIELTEHERRANTDITMWKYGVLTGMLVDEGGEPLVDVQVRAVRRMLVSGKRQLMFVGTTRTDDRGMYRIANLLPGDYNVFVPATVMSGGATFPPGGAPDAWLRSMTGEGTAPLLFDFDSGVAARNSRAVVASMLGVRTTPSADASWLVIPSSFAGAPGVAGAAAFTIASGEERAGIDMQLRVTPTVPVSGVLSMPGGSPANLVLHLMSAGLESFPLFDVATATADGSGAFTFFGVPPGDYVIRVVRVPMAPGMSLGVASSLNGYAVRMMGGGPGAPPPVPTEPLWHATEKVSVGSVPVQGLQMTMRAGPRISGRAEFIGSAKKPEGDQWTAVQVAVEHANGYRSLNPPRSAPFSADGAFATQSLLPGDYYVRAGAPSGWTVKSITWQGHNLIDAPLALAGTDVSDVVVTYTDQPGSIGGTVYAQGDAADASATVLIFPTDHELWTEYGTTSPRMTSLRTKTDGTFRSPPLVEGDYFLIAVSDEQATEWQDPAMLEKLARTAKRVIVRDGEQSHENLKTERVK